MESKIEERITIAPLEKHERRVIHRLNVQDRLAADEFMVAVFLADMVYLDNYLQTQLTDLESVKTVLSKLVITVAGISRSTIHHAKLAVDPRDKYTDIIKGLKK